MELNRETVDALLTTTRAVRKRLDFSRDVPREVIMECLRLAIQAPTGSNMQGWRWMIVTDPDKRAALAEMYRKGFEPYMQMQMDQAAGAAPDPVMGRVAESAIYLSEHMGECPVLVIPCIEGYGLPMDQNIVAASFYGSIFPAVWSFQLALRSRGLGSALTTLHLSFEAEARELLGIPEHVVQVGLLPVAYYTGEGFKPAPRTPVESITYWNDWA